MSGCHPKQNILDRYEPGWPIIASKEHKLNLHTEAQHRFTANSFTSGTYGPCLETNSAQATFKMK